MRRRPRAGARTDPARGRRLEGTSGRSWTDRPVCPHTRDWMNQYGSMIVAFRVYPASPTSFEECLRAEHAGYPHRLEKLLHRVGRDRGDIDDLVRRRRGHVNASAEVRDEQKVRDFGVFEVERHHESRQSDLLAVESADHRRRANRLLVGVEELHGPRAVVGEALYVIVHRRLYLGERIPALGHELLPFEVPHLTLHGRCGTARRQRDDERGGQRDRGRRCAGAEFLSSSCAHVHILIERPSASDSR